MAAETPSFGVKTADEGSQLKLATVYDDSAARRAGLSAGDILVAINDLRVTSTNIDKLLTRYQAGDTVKVHAFRRDELKEFRVRLDRPPDGTARLVADARPNSLRRRWLGI